MQVFKKTGWLFRQEKIAFTCNKLEELGVDWANLHFVKTDRVWAINRIQLNSPMTTKKAQPHTMVALKFNKYRSLAHMLFSCLPIHVCGRCAGVELRRMNSHFHHPPADCVGFHKTFESCVARQKLSTVNGLQNRFQSQSRFVWHTNPKTTPRMKAHTLSGPHKRVRWSMANRNELEELEINGLLTVAIFFFVCRRVDWQVFIKGWTFF